MSISQARGGGEAAEWWRPRWRLREVSVLRAFTGAHGSNGIQPLWCPRFPILQGMPWMQVASSAPILAWPSQSCWAGSLAGNGWLSFFSFWTYINCLTYWQPRQGNSAHEHAVVWKKSHPLQSQGLVLGVCAPFSWQKENTACAVPCIHGSHETVGSCGLQLVGLTGAGFVIPASDQTSCRRWGQSWHMNVVFCHCF